MKSEEKIYGLHSVIEAIKSGTTIDKLYIQKGLRGDTFLELQRLISESHLNVSYVPIEKLNRLTRKNHQGVVAQISPIDFMPLEELVIQAMESGNPPLFLLLDQLSDVRNFGAIIRTAECAGVSGIIIQKKGGAPVTADTVKTSAGAIFKVPICKVDHIKDAVYYLQASGIQVVAATEKSDEMLYDVDFKLSTGIIMGSEGKGINPSVLKAVDKAVKLPMLGTISSLNVSVACGMFLYETMRQRLLP
ncbi:23S rRNA (guanosine(2251)-2'-O)-methyltransferase RlmB [Aegicerativicinus sediminis]|uniref:23S rRNA (guanosine(2251)-2'-O)-methyltransferase RlmB n=1 Tax=Aegicerativicinus sediminis TaxID=2893202 RepID=UPI001E5B1199|nr:23S rRNA (guanosine(2251)-2'-O)-methyltransferase RlmB [Aegicerativicinus sediminis]